MMRRRARFFVALLAGVMAAALVSTHLGKSGAPRARSPSEHASERPGHVSSSQPAAPQTADTRARSALERFRAQVREVSNEQLAQERARLDAARERLGATVEVPPGEERITDPEGNVWVRLTYASGEVRYVLPEE